MDAGLSKIITSINGGSPSSRYQLDRQISHPTAPSISLNVAVDTLAVYIPSMPYRVGEEQRLRRLQVRQGMHH